ncbi:MAG: L-threonylcarbamoyladenylate synthase, partial [candidate division WOR-3 bacterium]|nr:L-threonylcarbamoyladenylate synthase [candidate division WOR-3 bacterium]
KIIQNGGLVAFPTETVYGLGASAFNPYAVAKIFKVKNRPNFDPIIVHIADFSELDLLVKACPPKAQKLIEKFWPGPLTVVLPKTSKIPEIVTAGLPSVAVRMPAHPVAHAIIKKARVPIAAPSANKFGYLSPTTAEHVKKQLNGKIDLIIDGGKCTWGIESTVVYFEDDNVTILRHGAIPKEEIEEVIGPVKTLKKTNRVLSPGTLPKHYAPKTPVIILTKKTKIDRTKKIGLLAFRPPTKINGFYKVEILSKNGDYIEAAANLFEALHRLDEGNLDLIYAQKVKEIGLGRAIMERLKKASYKEKS